MGRGRKRWGLFVVLLAVIGVQLTPIAYATHGGPYHWAMRNPTVVDGTRDHRTQLANKWAVDSWNAIKANVQYRYRIDDSACGRGPAKYEVVVCYTQIGTGDKDEGGIARLWIDGSDGSGHLTTGRVWYDNEARTFRTQFSLDSLACHEIGHELGFSHHTDPYEGCMHPATQRDRPGVHDASDLRALYAHLDQYGAPQPGPSPDPDPAAPPARRCLVTFGGQCWWYGS